MSNVDDILQSMQARFNPSAAAGLELTFQFDIADADNYFLVVKDGACQLQAGEAESPDVTLRTDKQTMKDIIAGETSGMSAFMAGRLRADGNMMLALKLSELFPS